jgi:hypothetical protein
MLFGNIDHQRSTIRARAPLAIRGAICRNCRWRPAGSEHLDPHIPRTCEASCSLFKNLPALLETAQCVDPIICSHRRALLAQIKRLCRRQPEAPACPSTDGRPSPLWFHRERLVKLLEMLVQK